ncbi:hypothetical protein DFJ74DRAFT_764133 [Hyaloraphidium curvatum]|nr:hypothetical protein DFJ74DRAFT_764133 [Hyaloraphidium curvatum]
MTEAPMSLSLLHVFGLNSQVPPGISLLAEDQVVVYPAGSRLVFSELETKTQTFIELPNPISAFAVDGRKKFVAVAERTAEKPSITVYDVATRKVRKTFLLPADSGDAKEFVSVAISPDGKHVVGQLAAPDWTLYLWQWDKPRPVASFVSSKKSRSRQSSMLKEGPPSGELDGSSTVSGSGLAPNASQRGSFMGSSLSFGSNASRVNEAPPVYQVSFHPTDPLRVVVVGLGVLHLLRIGDTQLESVAAPLTRSTALKRTDITAHTWTSDGAWLVVGTSDGRVIAYTVDGELVGESVHLGGTPPTPRGVRSLVPWSRGVVGGGDFGSIVVFERLDLGAASIEAVEKAADASAAPSKAGASQAASVVNSRPGSPAASPKPKPGNLAPIFRRMKTMNPGGEDVEHVLGLAMTSTEDYLLASTDTKQVYRLSLMDRVVDSSERSQHPLEAFHRGPITSLDVCVRRPLVATSGPDKTVRIWNYVDKTIEVSRQFMDDPYSLALHPSGLYILVGFPDKLRLMSVVIDDLRMYEEIPLRGCRECQFSNGGHLFAAVQGTSVHVYKTWTYELVASFREHNGKIKSIQWSDDDSHLVSAGFDGSVFIWNWSSGAKEFESTVKTTMYGCAWPSRDRSILWASGYGDKSLREWAGAAASPRDWTLDANVTSMSTSADGRSLFLGLSNGTVCVAPLPLSSSASGGLVVTKHKVSHAAVTKIRVSPDGRELFATSDDGGLYIYSCAAAVVGTSGTGAAPVDPELGRIFPDEVLTTKSDLEERLQEMRDLETRIQEMKSEHDYQLKMKEMQHKENMRSATESLSKEIERLAASTSAVTLELQRTKDAHSATVAGMIATHAQELQKMEDEYTKKLLSEFDRVDSLGTNLSRDRTEFEMRLQAASDAHKDAVEKMEANERLKMAARQREYDSLKAEMDARIREAAEVLDQTKNRMNVELAEQKQKYDALLLAERNTIISLKADNGILRKKAQGSQTEIEAHKAEVVKKVEEIKRLQGVIKGLERDIVALNREIRERDDTIQDKDRHIYDVKKKNQELEKFKFVLDYKIRELREQIEPKDQELEDLQARNRDLDMQLQQASKMTYDLDGTILEMKMKAKALEKELAATKAELGSKETALTRIRFDVAQCARFLELPQELRTHAIAIYRKYCSEEAVEVEPRQSRAEGDPGMVGERGETTTAEQAAQHQRVLAELRSQLEKERSKAKAEAAKMVRENLKLIDEIKVLKTELDSRRGAKKV